MGSVMTTFSAYDFPRLDTMSVKQISRMDMNSKRIGNVLALAQELRRTLPFWKRRAFDKLTLMETMTLVNDYLNLCQAFQDFELEKRGFNKPDSGNYTF